MRLALVFCLAPALLALPAALSAQIAPGSQPDRTRGPVDVRIEPPANSDYELQRSRDAIRAGRKGGTLTRSQARGLRREANQTDTLAARYARDGLSQSEEQRELDIRGRALQSLTQAERTRPKRP